MCAHACLSTCDTCTSVNIPSSGLLPADRALEVPLTDLSFEDREIILSEGDLRIYDFSSLLEFNHLVCRLGWVEGRLDQRVRLGRLCLP